MPCGRYLPNIMVTDCNIVIIAINFTYKIQLNNVFRSNVNQDILHFYGVVMLLRKITSATVLKMKL